MPKIVIKATKFSHSPESWDVFQQRGWKKILDITNIPKNKRTVKTDQENTSLIDLLMEEIEYD